MAGSRLFNLIKPKSVYAIDIQSAALWGVAAGTGALFVVQPFGWIKKTFIDKPEPEEK